MVPFAHFGEIVLALILCREAVQRMVKRTGFIDIAGQDT